ncbi:MAG: SusF/SusE family outer membrane protein [Prevotellaceae bacterium]|jgi:hypothetical protein|nr:SusF/SusE family outer membrane protein [Prevotellaceae bacterium]
MKNIKFISFLIIVTALILSSCKNDNAPQLTDVVSGEFDALPVSEFALAEPASGNPLIVTLTWTKTKFYLDSKEQPVGNVKYLVEADIAGNNFANAVTFAASDDSNPLAANLFVNDINSVLLNDFKAMAGQNLNLELRLKTIYGDNSNVNFIYSITPLAVKFTAFRPENELIPACLIGDMNAWNLNGREFLMYRDDNKVTNHVHTYTGKFGANTHFKFCSEIALGDEEKMFGKGENNKLVIGGADFVLETEGYYTLTINDKEMTYSIDMYDVESAAEYAVMGFVGAFCGWGEGGADPEMQNFTVKTNSGANIIDTHNWYLEIQLDNIDYGVKFRANHGWGDRWCPVKSTENPYGLAEHNPTSDPNIDIAAQGIGKYEVRFNDLTGHYFVKKIE